MNNTPITISGVAVDTLFRDMRSNFVRLTNWCREELGLQSTTSAERIAIQAVKSSPRLLFRTTKPHDMRDIAHSAAYEIARRDTSDDVTAVIG